MHRARTPSQPARHTRRRRAQFIGSLRPRRWEPGSTLPSAIATGRGIYQSTSLPAITTLGAINIALPTPLNGDTAVLEAGGGVVFCVLLGAELPRPATRCERSAMPKLSHAWHAASVMCAAFHAL